MNEHAKRYREYFQALLEKNSQYEGIFYVGVKTTGVFCRPPCPARKPKFEHCEFFSSAEEALAAGYRPCKRCHPLSHPNQISAMVQNLVDAVEENPAKRWTEKDFAHLAIDPSTIRRQFKKRFGMTFVEYARNRRMAVAMTQLQAGEPVIHAQLNTGYESGSGFRDAFAKIMGAAPTKTQQHYNVLHTEWLDTPLGPMIAVADENVLYFLGFMDQKNIARAIERLKIITRSTVVPGRGAPILSIAKELKSYFSGELQHFTTPLAPQGSPFQKQVWEGLLTIPYAQTKSYCSLAEMIGKPAAYRAVANANGANPISIVIPCHRVINHSGGLGGYGGGIARKKWLLQHEQKFCL